MAFELGALDAKELVLVAVALVGLIPVVTQRTEGSRLFTLGYALLVFGAVATNAEHLFLGEVLGLLEHAVGIGAAGLLFLVAAYRRRQRIVTGNELGGGDGDDESPSRADAAVTDGGEVA
ncbi:hypothetical protein [Halobaculum marinum]|uniref:Uncharacterized protein n=1 Tax=Halobaculum marinum TaxID=3031996 RepID=A0ABD5WRY1_9EURY|nr:hypothetical protein [Halobaculum sp. DT55]